jgi:hypothetical protein
MVMTSEQRLDRLERIVKLMIKAGLRARRQSREQDEKINILINLQIKNEELFAKNEERFAKNEERFAKNDGIVAALAASQASADERLKSFMATVERIITERRNGKP